MRVISGKPHFRLPDYVYVLTRELLPETLSVADSSRQSHRFEIRDLATLASREDAELEVRRGDIFLIEIEAIQPQHVEWLEAIAKIGADNWTIALIPWSYCRESEKAVAAGAPELNAAAGPPLESDAEYIGRRLRQMFQQPYTSMEADPAYFLEFQGVRLNGINPDSIGELLASLNRMNYRSIRDGMINLFSVLYLLGSLVFGVTAPVACLAILTARWFSGDVGSWGIVACFLAGPALYAWLCGKLNWMGMIPLFSLVYFASEAVAQRDSNGVLLLPVVVVSMVVFVLFNRGREYMDARDLLACIFSREICHNNPGFRIPERMPSPASGEFILWRLGRLNVWRFFDAYTLSRVFITHRNSPSGLALTQSIGEALDEEWEVFFDHRSLKSGTWRDQLADGFYGTGVLICILTLEDRSQLKWIRRELAAASLRYAAYGTPIPLVVEAGMTLEDVLKEDEDTGRFDTPIHLVKDRLPRIKWVGSATTSNEDAATKAENLVRLRTQLRSAVEAELSEQVPAIIKEGLVRQFGRLFVPAALTVAAGLFWIDLSILELRNTVTVALVVLSSDLGGLSLGTLLPRWLGGLDRRTAWLSMQRATIRPFHFALAVSLIVWVLASRQWPNPLVLAVVVGLSINLLDHELWQSARVKRLLRSTAD